MTERIELNAPVEKVFEYFTDTDQLAKQLPQSLRLKILDRTSRHLNQGSSIEFSARVYGFPIRWKSYIHSLNQNRHIAYLWQKNSFFVYWEHDYYFESTPDQQTRIVECILYRLPLGILGRIVDRIFVRPLIQRFLRHRRQVLISTFGVGQPKKTKPKS
jgi:ligand-binding SRPBCC domain-containing protein